MFFRNPEYIEPRNVINLFQGGRVIDNRNYLLKDNGCRLLLGVLVSFLAIISCCMCYGKHLIIAVDGQELPVIYFRGTVGDVLDNAHVTLRKADIVTPELNRPVGKAQRISVIRVDSEEITEQEFTKFTVQRKPDISLAPGEKKVLQQGSYGLKRSYIQITYENGKEVKRENLRSEVIRKPKPMIVAYGPNVIASRGKTRPVAGGAIRSASYNFQPQQSSNVLNVVSTAYTHTGHRTATGIYPYEGVVAVDPRVIPLGTKLYVENYGYAVAADTGGVIKGNKIDVFFNTYNEAINWGRRTVKVYILD